MTWVKWVAPILLLLAGIAWAMPGTLDALTETSLAAGFTLGNLLGWVAVVIGAWTLYEMATKK